MNAHAPVIQRAVARFLATGEWPEIVMLQRDLAKEGSDADVAEAVREMPYLPGLQRQLFPQRLSIPLWLLSYVEEASPVLETCFAIVRRAIELYLSDDPDPHIRSDDPALISSGVSPEHVELSGHVLYTSYPHPFAGGTGGDVGPWDYLINQPVVHQLRGVDSIRAYIDKQFEIASKDANYLAPFVAGTGTEGEVAMPMASPDRRRVFVIHGRNEPARKALFAFLRAIGLDPIEWSKAIAMTGKGSPYIGEVLDAAFGAAQAVVVLQTPDDVAYLHPSLTYPGDAECDPQMQPRPNVLFEAGMAMGRDADRTVIVEMGQVKVFSDIHGRHVVRIDNTVGKRQDLAQRLETAGCSVDTSGTDWHEAGDLTPPSSPGEGLPLGRKMPSARVSSVPVLDAKYIEHGGNRMGEVEVINKGPGDVYELNVTAEDKVGLVLRTQNELPVPKLPAGKTVRMLRAHAFDDSESYFNITVTGKTVDGTPIEQEIFVSA